MLPAPIYEASPAGDRLHQGHVLSDFTEWQVSIEGDEGAAIPILHPFVVVVTQDCDLVQDFNARSNPHLAPAKRLQQQLTHVLLVVAEEFEATERFDNSKLKAQAKKNQEPRLQYLAACGGAEDATSAGFPALLLDFKRVFSVPYDHLSEGAAGQRTARRAFLRTPYAEHLSVRLGYFLQRVGLPVDHHDATPTPPPALPGPVIPQAPAPSALAGAPEEPVGHPALAAGEVRDPSDAAGSGGASASPATAPDPGSPLPDFDGTER